MHSKTLFYLSVSVITVVSLGLLLQTNALAYFTSNKLHASIKNYNKSRKIPTPTPTRKPNPTPKPTVTPTLTSAPTLIPTLTLTPTTEPLITPDPTKPYRVNPVCASAHLNRLSITDADKQLSLMQQAGVSWVRFDFGWNEMESVEGNWDFSKYDHIIDTANSKGINVIALMVQWGQPEYIRNGRSYMSPSSAEEYGYFVANATAHFKGRIRLYELGNEPNISVFWPPAPDVNAYSALLKAGYLAVKQNDPQAKVITAGLAPVDDWQGFIHGMYTTGNIKGYFDYIGYHPYSSPASPDTMIGTTFSNLLTVKYIEQSYGDNKPIMATEVGWPTFSEGVTESQQADYINRVYQKIMFEDYQYVPVACIYDFINDGTNVSDAEDNFGVIRADYSLKPSFSTLQEVRQKYDFSFSSINP